MRMTGRWLVEPVETKGEDHMFSYYCTVFWFLYLTENAFFFSDARESDVRNHTAVAKKSKMAEKRPADIPLSGIESESGYSSSKILSFSHHKLGASAAVRK